MGYTPLFDTLLNGTMYGKWPHNGIWALLLSRASREGLINEVPESLAAHIGVSVEQLMTSINYFMEPDPNSRTPGNDGRRLELIDSHKNWGWRVVNHGAYREKARKSAYDSERTASGTDAARKREERERASSAENRPDASRRVPLSEAEANTRKEADGSAASLGRLPLDEPPPPGLNPIAWARWVEYRKALRKPIKAPSVSAAQRDMARLGARQEEAVEHTIAKGWQGLRLPDQHPPQRGGADNGLPTLRA